MRKKKSVIVGTLFLHLFSFKTPTKWMFMSEGNVTIWAFSTQNGVKVCDGKTNVGFAKPCVNNVDAEDVGYRIPQLQTYRSRNGSKCIVFLYWYAYPVARQISIEGPWPP
jgi:hypothetical protein